MTENEDDDQQMQRIDPILNVFLLLLQESLDEVTVKDMLEGDNMYTCSKCQKKVRAEKR